MGLRRKAREYALQALYLADITKLDQTLIFKSVTILHKHEKPMMEFTERLFTKTREHILAIDEKIKVIADNWEISRMAVLDRNIIRMAAYEIIYELDTPVSVIINEAVELAKAFSTDESGKFVNGILDKLKKERQSADHGTKKNNA